MMLHEIRPNLRQKLVCALLGNCYVGTFHLAGWVGNSKFYLIKCSRHGYQVTYPHGYNEFLPCPECWIESLKGAPP